MSNENNLLIEEDPGRLAEKITAIVRAGCENDFFLLDEIVNDGYSIDDTGQRKRELLKPYMTGLLTASRIAGLRPKDRVDHVGKDREAEYWLSVLGAIFDQSSALQVCLTSLGFWQSQATWEHHLDISPRDILLELPYTDHKVVLPLAQYFRRRGLNMRLYKEMNAQSFKVYQDTRAFKGHRYNYHRRSTTEAQRLTVIEWLKQITQVAGVAVLTYKRYYRYDDDGYILRECPREDFNMGDEVYVPSNGGIDTYRLIQKLDPKIPNEARLALKPVDISHR